MTVFRKALTSLRRFTTRDDGAVSIEAAVILPVLAIVYIGGFAYFDTYRREAILTKATYTIGDILSREVGRPTKNEFEGLQDLFEFLTYSEGKTWMRFSQIERNASGLQINWQYATDGGPDLTMARLGSIQHRIPKLENGQMIVVTESYTTHSPAFDIGLLEREFVRIAPTRSRFVEITYDPTVPLKVDPEPIPFDPEALEAPTLPLFDTIARSFSTVDPGTGPGDSSGHTWGDPQTVAGNSF